MMFHGCYFIFLFLFVLWGLNGLDFVFTFWVFEFDRVRPRQIAKCFQSSCDNQILPVACRLKIAAVLETVPDFGRCYNVGVSCSFWVDLHHCEKELNLA